MILTSSGTSVLEASMLNIVNPDDHFVVIVSGAFGNRFKQIAETYYKNVHIYNVEWGQSIDIKEFITYLNNLNHQISAVFTPGAFGNRFKQIAETYYKMYTYIMWNGDNPLILKNS